MSPPEPPRRGTLPSVTEVNAARGPHTPIPPPDVRTKPPPAMPMDPPRQYARRPEPTLVGSPAPPPPSSIRDSHEISVDSILTELASKAEEARLAKAEADALREALTAAQRLPSPDSLSPGAERKALIKLAYKLGTPLVLLMGAATAWLSAHTANVEAKVDRVEETRKMDKVVTDPLPEKISTNERAAVSCQEWARAYDDYNRQIWARFGVAIPRHPNALPSSAVEFSAPKAKPNRLSGGVILEVRTPPPPLP